MTTYLNFDVLDSFDPASFQETKPFPWVNPSGGLTDEGFQKLIDNMPDVALFKHNMGYARRAGQKPHDRYSLEYTPELEVPEPWEVFIRELRSDRYRNWVAGLFGEKKPPKFRFHWHYTPSACSVSPHCDAMREFGSHIFYFNSEQDWDPKWGGDTLVFDDGGKLDRNSAPSFDDFKGVSTACSLGNHSMLFKNGPHSWHGVEEIECPEGEMRKVFIVVVNPDSLFWKVRDLLIGKQIQRL